MNMNKPTTRVLAALELLQTHGRMSGRELAERLAVNGRTLRRYVRSLEDLGVPVTTERGRYGNYGLIAGYKLPPMMFTNEEALALAIGLLAARGFGFSDTASAIASAQAKLERVLPAELRQRIRAFREAVTVDVPPARAVSHGAELMTLAGAAQAQRRVHLRYRPERGEPSERDVDPYGLVYRSGRWYVAGFCHLRQGMRSFRVDRIEEAWELKQAFERPPGFDVAKYLDASFASIPRAFPVEILLRADLETAMAELRCPHGVLEPQPDGVLLRTRTDSQRWFAQFLLRLPFEYEIRRPAGLRRAVKARALRVLRMIG
jgi:predicted DNA-binding transcriptional regulator YafY